MLWQWSAAVEKSRKRGKVTDAQWEEFWERHTLASKIHPKVHRNEPIQSV